MKAKFFAVAILIFSCSAVAEWKIDFSRRQNDLKEMEKQRSISSAEKRTFLDMVSNGKRHSRKW